MAGPSAHRRYVAAVGPRLRKLLMLALVMFAVLCANSAYLGAISLLEWMSARSYQDFFYQYMFLAHLVLGLAIILPVVVYGILHIRNAHGRPNRRAVKVGYALFALSLVLLASGLVLTRGLPLIEIKDPQLRTGTYWLHVLTPLLVAWAFVLHRLAGKRINWRVGGIVASVAVVIGLAAVGLRLQDPRAWNVSGPASGEQYFHPSLARTSSGNFVPAASLMMDGYCAECHADAHETWSASVHRFASFNNPAYLFSVRGTRAKLLERDGSVEAARFCAGCHDPVPFFSGAFDAPDFDDVGDPTSQAGITCTSCHAITHVNSVRGNADYTIEEPLHYPFAFSEHPLLRWINHTLVKANPTFHKRTFLKPLHGTAEFCGACHKVHLPEELNRYKWLRGQNHYDSFLLSGVSGHGAQSFYYPEKAEPDCNGCHMPLEPSEDFGARDFDSSGKLSVHDHQFASGNTAIPHLLALGDEVLEKHRDMLRDSLRVDVFGVREDGEITGALHAPLRPGAVVLEPGRTYLLQVVLRTLTLGHHFTQGTADSNQVWLDAVLRSGDTVVGRSGGFDPAEGRVDPWAHFVNAYVLDRDGRRIDRRNAEDIFTALYDNQIPPGAAQVVHYRFTVPEEAQGDVSFEVSLRYRKFDTTYLRLVQGEAFAGNHLPVTTIATDRVMFPVGPAGRVAESRSDIPAWQRWNDYGIGLLRIKGTGALRQAETAFREVEALGRAEGALNLARVYLREGRLDDAVAALGRAQRHDPPAPGWVLSYLTGVANKQNGYLDEAIENFRAVLETQFGDARERGFDFSKDYRVSNELGLTLFERAKLERGGGRAEARADLLRQSVSWFEHTLELDPENVTAHYGLAQAYSLLDDPDGGARHRALHARYKPDDNAADRSIATARRADPAANRAAEAVVIYDLQRAGAPGVSSDVMAAR